MTDLRADLLEALDLLREAADFGGFREWRPGVTKRMEEFLGDFETHPEGPDLGGPQTTTGEVKAFDRYATNAGLVEAAARLGYLHTHRPTLDATWGQGTFWDEFRPERLVALDHVLWKVRGTKRGVAGDFTALPFPDRAFWATVFDGPYKLNGTPDEAVDARYGVHVPRTWQERIELLEAGVRECGRVTSHVLLVKCMDQVSSGRVRWQTRLLEAKAVDVGFRLEDELYIEGGRPQPGGRRQVHARRNYSTLQVYVRAGMLL